MRSRASRSTPPASCSAASRRAPSRRDAGDAVALAAEQVEHAALADQMQRADRDEAAAGGVEPLERGDPRRAAIVDQVRHLAIVLGGGVAVAERFAFLGDAEREHDALVA